MSQIQKVNPGEVIRASTINKIIDKVNNNSITFNEDFQLYNNGRGSSIVTLNLTQLPPQIRSWRFSQEYHDFYIGYLWTGEFPFNSSQGLTDIVGIWKVPTNRSFASKVWNDTLTATNITPATCTVTDGTEIENWELRPQMYPTSINLCTNQFAKVSPDECSTFLQSDLVTAGLTIDSIYYMDINTMGRVFCQVV